MSRCPFVPGQKNFLVPASRCPGTRAGANVPGQTPLSRPVPGQNDLKIFKKKDQISHFRTSASKNKCRICQRLPHNFSKTAWLYNDRVCQMSYKQYCKWKDSFTLIYRQATNGKQKYRLLRHWLCHLNKELDIKKHSFLADKKYSWLSA